MPSLVPVERHLREALLFLYKLKKTPADAHQLLVEAYGENTLNERTCREWFERFRTGDFDATGKEYGKLEEGSYLENTRSLQQLDITQEDVTQEGNLSVLRELAEDWKKRNTHNCMRLKNAIAVSGITFLLVYSLAICVVPHIMPIINFFIATGPYVYMEIESLKNSTNTSNLTNALNFTNATEAYKHMNIAPQLEFFLLILYLFSKLFFFLIFFFLFISILSFISSSVFQLIKHGKDVILVGTNQRIWILEIQSKLTSWTMALLFCLDYHFFDGIWQMLNSSTSALANDNHTIEILLNATTSNITQLQASFLEEDMLFVQCCIVFFIELVLMTIVLVIWIFTPPKIDKRSRNILRFFAKNIRKVDDKTRINPQLRTTSDIWPSMDESASSMIPLAKKEVCVIGPEEVQSLLKYSQFLYIFLIFWLSSVFDKRPELYVWSKLLATIWLLVICNVKRGFEREFSDEELRGVSGHNGYLSYWSWPRSVQMVALVLSTLWLIQVAIEFVQLLSSVSIGSSLSLFIFLSYTLFMNVMFVRGLLLKAFKQAKAKENKAKQEKDKEDNVEEDKFNRTEVEEDKEAARVFAGKHEPAENLPLTLNCPC